MTIDFKALAASMSGKEVKKLTKKYKDKKTQEWKQYSINYITSRTVMNRLDRVAGPQNWRDEYITRADGVVVCTLFLRIGDEWVGKTDAGTESDIEGDKGAFADALKRAAAKWGIGRELYGDGTAFDFAPTTPPPATPAPQQRPAQTSKAGADAEPPPSKLDEHFGPRDNVQGDGTLFTGAMMLSLKRELTSTGVAKHEEHAQNIIFEAMREAHQCDTFTDIFKYTVVDVRAAVNVNRANQPAAEGA